MQPALCQVLPPPQGVCWQYLVHSGIHNHDISLLSPLLSLPPSTFSSFPLLTCTHTHVHCTSYKSGLLAFNALQCVGDYSESETKLADQYGADAGLAFWLLGELNSRLNLTKEATKFFKTALKYNPFLWTAYQSLCEYGKMHHCFLKSLMPWGCSSTLCLGEFVEPKKCFKISEYPSFLKSSINSVAMTSQSSLFSQAAPTNVSTAVPHPGHTQAGDIHVDLVCTEPSEIDTATPTLSGAMSVVGGVKTAEGGVTTAVGGVTSAFSSVNSSKGLVTPNLYGPPAVGKAVASSTPAAARSLNFTGSDGVQQYQPSLSVGVRDKGKNSQILIVTALSIQKLSLTLQQLFM